jgi:ribosomal protein S4
MSYKRRNKPFYKQFLRLRENIQDRPKLFTFKKNKWQKIHRNLKNQLKFFQRFKIKDQFQLPASRFASRGNSFQRKFQNNLRERKIFSLFYGGLKKNYLKKSILKSVKTKNYINRNLMDYRHIVFRKFESRLDVVLYRANFTSSIQEASQLILHGHVLVNGRPVRVKSHNLRTNDLVDIAHNKKSRGLVKRILEESRVLIESKKT